MRVYAKTPTAGEKKRASPVDTTATRFHPLGFNSFAHSRASAQHASSRPRSRPSTFGASSTLKHLRPHDGGQGPGEAQARGEETGGEEETSGEEEARGEEDDGDEEEGGAEEEAGGCVCVTRR